MAKIVFEVVENNVKKERLVIYDREDTFNELKMYKNGLMIKNYKCRIECLSINMLYEKLTEAFEKHHDIEIGYPNAYFRIEDNELKLMIYPGDYYTIDINLGSIDFINIKVE